MEREAERGKQNARARSKPGKQRRDPLEGNPWQAFGSADASCRAIPAATDLRGLGNRLQALFDAMVDGLLLVDEDGVVLAINPVAERIFGYTLNEAIGQCASMLVHPDTRTPESFVEGVLHALASDSVEISGREIVGLRKDGTEIALELWVRELPHGLRRSFLCTLRECGARKEREEALHASDRRFRHVIDAFPGLVAYIDAEGLYIECSRAHEDWFGVPRDLMVGEHVREVLGDAARVAMLNAGHPVYAGKPFEFRATMPFRRNGALQIHAVYVPNVASSGAVLGHYVFVRDLTGDGEKRLELDKAHRLMTLGQLTGGLVHDFNNLHGILTADLEALGDTDDWHERERIVANAMSTVRSGSELMRQLLAFARRQPLHAITVDVGYVIDCAAALMRRAVGRHIEIRTSAPPGLWKVRVSQGLFESALLNLIHNARDAMPNGGTITIAAVNSPSHDHAAGGAAGPPSGDYVRLSVADTGNGMSNEVAERVFEPFFTTKEAGTGLGLAMVQGFLKRSGGRTLIESAVGEGTTVHLFLPRARAGHADMPAAQK